ncbi:MAG: 50S ribosomal protein L6 [Clostridia bacterium]|nr:50S ribosomal protein L6 [Clostridia bacterium]
MSRIGKLPIAVPSGVTITIDDDNLVTVKGPKGTLSQKVNKDIEVKQENGVLSVNRPSDSKPHKSMHGLYRALIANMVKGVTTGFSKTLLMEGVGYRATAEGKKLTLAVGYSHPVVFEAPQDVSFETPAANRIIVHGIDKQVVGAIAADIREVRKPEPYLGKGIRYEDEHIRRKEGKAGKK